jgi:type II restriction enzyme
MKDRDFDFWLNSMTTNIATFDYYTDFNIVYKNAEMYKRELYLLNTLIGSRLIETEFKALVAEYPQVLKAIPILIAKREMAIEARKEGRNYLINFNGQNTIEEYCMFMEETGLYELMQHRLVSNLYDYVLGVNVGMDTHGRKSRTGDLMEDLVEHYIQKAGFIKGITYYKEMSVSEMESVFDVDLSKFYESGIGDKRFDFVLKTGRNVVGVECNFYTGGGSKLSEICRAYQALSSETSDIDRFSFVWVTDGYNGWRKHRKPIKEAFYHIGTVLNVNDLEWGAFTKIKELNR